MPTRRIVWKRIAAGSLASILLLMSYIAGEPFLTELAICRFPAAIRVVSAVYTPLTAYRMRGLPGATALRSYSLWGIRTAVPWFAPKSFGLQYPAPPVMIEHDGVVYRMRLTEDGKLVLDE